MPRWLSYRQPEGSDSESGDGTWAGGGAQPRPEEASEALQSAIGERPEADPVEGLELLQDAGQGGNDSVTLGIDVDPGIRKRLEQVREGGDRLRAGDPCGGHFLPGEVGETSSAVGHPVEDVVVECHDDPVGGQVDVGLEVAVTEVGGVLKGGERVLGNLLGSTAVGEGEYAGVVKKRVSGFVCTQVHGLTLIPSAYPTSTLVEPVACRNVPAHQDHRDDRARLR